MDGKLLILCDELPETKEHYSIKDYYFLKRDMIDPEDDPEKLFVTWDAIIPKNQSFIDACKYYGLTFEEMPPLFALMQEGKTDPKNGTIHGSLQEESYFNTLNYNRNRVTKLAQDGEDYQAEALDLSCQYPSQATEQFLRNFSSLLNKNGVVRILLCYKNTTDSASVRHRMLLMEAWKNQNRFMRDQSSSAEIVESIAYDDFGEVYSRANEEMLKIYSLPIFGISKM